MLYDHTPCIHTFEFHLLPSSQPLSLKLPTLNGSLYQRHIVFLIRRNHLLAEKVRRPQLWQTETRTKGESKMRKCTRRSFSVLSKERMWGNVGSSSFPEPTIFWSAVGSWDRWVEVCPQSPKPFPGLPGTESVSD